VYAAIKQTWSRKKTENLPRDESQQTGSQHEHTNMLLHHRATAKMLTDQMPMPDRELIRAEMPQ